MALLFGPENFEGGIPGAFDNVGTEWGAPNATLDTTSKVQDTNSVFFNCDGEGNASCKEALGSSFATIFLQLKGFIPSGYSFGAQGYSGFFQGHTISPDNEVFRWNIENYGANTVRLTFYSAAKGYTDTSINLPINSVFTVEMAVTMNASTGRVRVWLNNTTEGSPSYDSGTVNTGTVTFNSIRVGAYYIPEDTIDFYLDYISYDSAFIGSRSDAVTITTRVKDIISQFGIIPFKR